MLKSVAYDKNTKLKSLLCVLCILQVAQSKLQRIDNVGNSVQGTLRPHLRENDEPVGLKIRGKDSGETPSKPAASDDNVEPPASDDNVEETPASDDNVEKAPAADEEADKPDEDDDYLENERADDNSTLHHHHHECWFDMKPREHLDEIIKKHDKFKGVHEKFQKALGGNKFDKKMLDKMLKTRSIAERALQRFRGEPGTIPAGLNLGGYCMMRMPQSVLFFHRLKLRNNTRFRVNYLHNDIKHMTLDVRLSLNDLHLVGHYERAVTYSDPSVLFYRPTYGQVEFLLKDVDYRVQGRYRLLQDRLHIENIVTKLAPKEILMRFTSENNSKPIRIRDENIEEYLLRMQNDLDWWLKDYFNDFLIFFGLDGAKTNAQIQDFENEKTISLNRFADTVIKQARRRLREIGAASVRIPHFTLFAINGLEIRLKDGVIRGLDSVYRRSVTTGSVDAITVAETTIGFSNLKVEYKYDAFFKTGVPPLSGILVLNGDELIALMSLTVTRESDFLGLDVRFIQESKEQSLTIEGAANKMIANFRHLLEHHIVAIMSSSLINYIHQLSSLNRCKPLFIGRDDPRYKDIDSDDYEEDVSTKRDDQNDPTSPPSDDQNDEPTDPPQTDQNDEPEEKLEKSKVPTYVVSRNESVELEFPPKSGSEKGERMLLNVKEKFSLTKLKKGRRKH